MKDGDASEPYTLIFGNNFVTQSPTALKIMDETLFLLGSDSNGPFMTSKVLDAGNKEIIKVEKNVCTFYDKGCLDAQKNERSHILIKNSNGEIVLESRILDKKTILVSGIFTFPNFVLVATQNYLVLPSGKWMMHNKADAQNGPVLITESGIKTSTQ